MAGPLASLSRLVTALALVAILAGCSKGGQFDPTEVFNSDMFDAKKKLKGERVPVFPEGVPGTTTGVPPDLVKGYQPPPEAADALPNAPPEAQTAKAELKPKPKPKPKVAAAPPQKQITPAPTRINIGGTSKPSTTDQPGPAAAAPAWPAPQAAPAQQAGAPAWPTPPPAPGQQTAQPSKSIWPNAPATSQ